MQWCSVHYVIFEHKEQYDHYGHYEQYECFQTLWPLWTLWSLLTSRKLCTLWTLWKKNIKYEHYEHHIHNLMQVQTEIQAMLCPARAFFSFYLVFFWEFLSYILESKFRSNMRTRECWQWCPITDQQCNHCSVHFPTSWLKYKFSHSASALGRYSCCRLLHRWMSC